MLVVGTVGRARGENPLSGPYTTQQTPHTYDTLESTYISTQASKMDTIYAGAYLPEVGRYILYIPTLS